MTSPFGHAEFEASAAAVEAFLAQTYQVALNNAYGDPSNNPYLYSLPRPYPSHQSAQSAKMAQPTAFNATVNHQGSG